MLLSEESSVDDHKERTVTIIIGVEDIETANVTSEAGKEIELPKTINVTYMSNACGALNPPA